MDKVKGVIRAVSQPREFEGVLQIGFMIEDKWYNIPGTEIELKTRLKETIKKGNEVEFEYNRMLKEVLNLKVTKEAEEEKEGNWHDDMVNFEELLSAAHEKAKKDNVNLCIMTQLAISLIDVEKKRAFFKATVTTTKDEKEISRFEGHGDAEGITSETIKPHFMRMAETRAIARALRWYTNNAKCSDAETEK